MLNQIETKRMIGYRVTKLHFPDLNALHKDKQVALTMGGIWADDFIKTRMETYLVHWDEHNFGLWVFYSKETEEFIGRGGLVQKIIDAREEVEVGFAVMPKFWRQGYGEEMGRKSIEIGFKVHKRPDLIAHTLPINLASQSLIQKLGFKFEKEIIAFGLKQRLYRLKNPNLL